MLNQVVLYVLQRLCEIPSKSISSDSSEDIDLDGISHKLIASVYSSEDIDLDGTHITQLSPWEAIDFV